MVGLVRQFQPAPPRGRRGARRRRASSPWIGIPPHLLAVAIGISLLSVADAFLTLQLLQRGAAEVNPVMAALVDRSVAAFAALKMALTG